MTATIEFDFDFGSPNAYLCYRALPGVEARIGPVFVLTPVLLGGVFKATNNRSPVETFAQVPARLAYDRIEMQRFVRRHDIAQFRWNPHFPVNTLTLMRGAHAAQALGVFDAYVETVFAAMWERELDMADPKVLSATLDAAGLPTADLLATAQAPETKQALADATQALVDRGGFGIPTFFVGDAMFFGKDRLRDVEDAFVALTRRD